MTKRIMKRKRLFKMAECMPTLKAAMGKNVKHLAGYTLATIGMTVLQNVVIIELIRFISDALGAGERSVVLPYVGAFISAYLAAALLKKAVLF